jgi:hypothetical protein
MIVTCRLPATGLIIYGVDHAQDSIAGRAWIDTAAVAHAEPFQGLVPPVAGITRLCLQIHVSAYILFVAGKHDLTGLVEYPDLLHSLLGTDGLDDFVQTLPLIL